MRKLCVVLAFLCVSISSAHAGDAAQKYLPHATLVGKATLSFTFWDVYEASLYAPNGEFDENAPHALTLHYLIELKGKDIADRSIIEMKKQGFTNQSKLNDWHAQMLKLFPDVHKGTELTAVFTPSQSTHFYHNDQSIGSINDPEFTKQFADIWLSQKTSEPELRKKLLGQS
jgi:hypothetical protein